MDKIGYFLIRLIFCIIVFVPFRAKSQTDTVYVQSVDFDISTFISVKCENFETAFKGQIKCKTISEKDVVATLDDFLRKCKYSKTNYHINSRAKFIIKGKNADSIVICTDGYSISIDGRSINTNKKFTTFLRKLIDN